MEQVEGRRRHTRTLKLDSEMVFMKLRQNAIPRRSCKIQIHLTEREGVYEAGVCEGIKH